MPQVGCWGEWLLSSWTTSGSEHLHQSVMSSDHLRTGHPWGWSPFTIPSITIFTSRWSFILLMCPNSCNFLCFTTSTIVQRLRLCLSSTLWVSSYYISFRICHEFSGVCGFYCLRLGSIDQMRKVIFRRHHQINLFFWWSIRYCSRTSLATAFPISGLRGWSYDLSRLCSHCPLTPDFLPW